MLERIEPVVFQLLGAWLERRPVVRVSSTADLNDNVVDPSRGRVRHEVVDRVFAGDLVPNDPAGLIHAGGGGSVAPPGRHRSPPAGTGPGSRSHRPLGSASRRSTGG